MAKKRPWAKSPSTQNENVLYGLHAVEAVLNRHPERLLGVWVRDRSVVEKNQRLLALVDRVRRQGIACQLISEEQIAKKVGSVNHQGVCAEYRPAPALGEAELSSVLEQSGSLRLLVLDCVTDPHNLGACIRSAEALGVQGLVIPKDKSASLNGTVRRVASGAAEVLPIFQVTNLARAIEHMQANGLWVLGASCDPGARDIRIVNFPERHAMVMGSEGVGLRLLTTKRCDELIKIPMQGYVNSLNVSVATGIVLFASLQSIQSGQGVGGRVR